MRKAVLFIAMSLDGYIADRNGGVDWLNGQNESDESGDSYSVFIKDIDTVIMGWNTYHQVITELSPEEWPYADLKSYVITHREDAERESIIFSGEHPCDMVRRLRQQEGKKIWICGGADIVRQLMQEDLIDMYYISVIPTILGTGIRLFAEAAQERKLQLISTQSYNGIVDLIYERR